MWRSFRYYALNRILSLGIDGTHAVARNTIVVVHEDDVLTGSDVGGKTERQDGQNLLVLQATEPWHARLSPTGTPTGDIRRPPVRWPWVRPVDNMALRRARFEENPARDLASRLSLLAAALIGCQEIAFKVPDSELQGWIGAAAVRAGLRFHEARREAEEFERRRNEADPPDPGADNASEDGPIAAARPEKLGT